jgi:hypothetical protein
LQNRLVVVVHQGEEQGRIVDVLDRHMRKIGRDAAGKHHAVARDVPIERELTAALQRQA